MATMSSLGATAFLELPPAGTLVGLARRALPGIQLLAVKTPDDLEAAMAMLAEHDLHSDSHAPEWRLLVAPLGGTFRSAAVPEGTRGIGAQRHRARPGRDARRQPPGDGRLPGDDYRVAGRGR